MSSLRRELAAQAASAAAPIRQRHLSEQLPHWPYGTLDRLSHSSPCGADVLDALTTLVTLRRWLNWIEYRHLRRASRAHYLIPQGQYAIAGEVLGISSSGLTRRRLRLARTLTDGGQVKNSPSLPRIELPEAAEAAELLLDHRAGLDSYPAPPAEDLVGVPTYAAETPDAPDLRHLGADIRAALTIVVCLRRRFDDIEADLLDLGRQLGISNTDLGRPLGRLGIRATWKARARLRNGDRAGRRRRVQAPEPDEPIVIPEVSTLGAGTDTTLRQLIERLLAFRPVIDDADIDIWLSWLAEHVADTLTDRTPILLRNAAEEIGDDPHSQSIDGLSELLREIQQFLDNQKKAST